MKIQVKEIVKNYAGDSVLNGLSLEIIIGSKVAIVGENGSGKSTLLKILAGVENYQSGEIFIPQGIKMAYMNQVFNAFEGDARTYILSNFKQYNEVKNKLSQLEIELSSSDNWEVSLNAYAKVQLKFESIGGYDFENNLEAYAKGLGVHDLLDQAFDSLSGGQKTRILLVQMLLGDAEVLCLDEPTNHLDLKGIEWLESFCRSTSKTLLIVSHDRVFLKHVASVFHEIEDGEIVTYHGGYDSYRMQRHQRYLAMVNDYSIQQKEIQRIKIAIRRYRQWGHESDNEDFFKRAKTLEKRLDKMNQLPKPSEIKNKLKLKLNVDQRSGKDVVVASELSIGYENVIQDNINFEVKWKDHFAIAAENGVGKTTLIKSIMQDIPILGGSLTVGSGVKIGYLSQQSDFHDRDERILEYVQKECSLSEFDARRSLASFGFYAHDVYKPLSYLSGGEGVRLRLLIIMMQKCNCLILDEPTNHLDILSCEIIEEVLIQYTGTIIIVTHDRMLLDKLNAQVYYLSNSK